MEADLLVVLEGALTSRLAGDGAVEAGDDDVDGVGGGAGFGKGEDLTAFDAALFAGVEGHVGDVDRGAHAGAGGFDALAMILNGANVGGQTLGLQDDFVAGGKGTA